MLEGNSFSITVMAAYAFADSVEYLPGSAEVSKYGLQIVNPSFPKLATPRYGPSQEVILRPMNAHYRTVTGLTSGCKICSVQLCTRASRIPPATIQKYLSVLAKLVSRIANSSKRICKLNKVASADKTSADILRASFSFSLCHRMPKYRRARESCLETLRAEVDRSSKGYGETVKPSSVASHGHFKAIRESVDCR